MSAGRDGLDAHAAVLAPYLTVLKPPGPGPFPVAVQLHGCGGITALQTRYAETARAAGFAAVVADSLKPRGIGRRAAQLTVCTGLRLRGAERALDLLALLHWLRGQPWAEAGRVVAAGWSHGGWAIMEALAGARSEAEADGLLEAVRTAVLVYPYAGPPSRTLREGWAARRPAVHACLGGRDAVVGSVAALRALQRLEEDGLAVRRLLLEDATHCFDDDAADDPRTRYRPDLEARAQDFYRRALDETLGL